MRSGALAAVAASSVANLYYGQPILASLGGSFGVSAGRAALVVVATLVGNGLAQFFMVPLADLVERRRLIQVLLIIQCGALLVMAGARDLVVAVFASGLIGLGGAAAMVVLPYAAGLAEPSRRGRSTGVVMGGVLLGILVSRSVSGFVSAAVSWRAVYVVGAGLAVGAAVLLRTFPRSCVEGRPEGYRRLLESVVAIVSGDRFVRRRMVVGALGFVSFNVLWTGLTLLLSGAPYHFSDVTIGVFGVVGLAGAWVARHAGRWFDRGLGGTVSRAGWWATGAAWLVLFAADRNAAVGVGLVVVGVGVLDAGMQAQHITNQAALIAARPDQSARVTTAYMSGNLVAGAVGSGLASVLFPLYGWESLVLVGLVCSAAAVSLVGRRGPVTRPEPVPGRGSRTPGTGRAGRAVR